MTDGYHRMTKEKQYAIYPFIHSFSNIRSTEQQLKPIYIPDVVPSNIPPTADFSMAAGEFVEVYRGDDSSRGTCFTQSERIRTDPVVDVD